MAPVVADADPNPLISLFRQCVVRISDGSGMLRGTGFFAAPGQAITCAHVVHGVPAIQVSWQGQLASAAVTGAVPPLNTVADPGAYPLPDLALLSIGDKAQEWDHPVRPLDDRPAGAGWGTGGAVPGRVHHRARRYPSADRHHHRVRVGDPRRRAQVLQAEKGPGAPGFQWLAAAEPADRVRGCDRGKQPGPARRSGRVRCASRSARGRLPPGGRSEPGLSPP